MTMFCPCLKRSGRGFSLRSRTYVRMTQYSCADFFGAAGRVFSGITPAIFGPFVYRATGYCQASTPCSLTIFLYDIKLNRKEMAMFTNAFSKPRPGYVLQLSLFLVSRKNCRQRSFAILISCGLRKEVDEMNFDDFKKRLLQDTEFKIEYEDLAPEYEIVRA